MTRDKTKTKHYFHVVYKENIVYTPVKYALGFVLELYLNFWDNTCNVRLVYRYNWIMDTSLSQDGIFFHCNYARNVMCLEQMHTPVVERTPVDILINLIAQKIMCCLELWRVIFTPGLNIWILCCTDSFPILKY